MSSYKIMIFGRIELIAQTQLLIKEIEKINKNAKREGLVINCRERASREVGKAFRWRREFHIEEVQGGKRAHALFIGVAGGVSLFLVVTLFVYVHRYGSCVICAVDTEVTVPETTL